MDCRIAPLMVALALGLGGCDTIGNPLEAVGGKAPAPDEFQVIARKPLVMPPSRDLPEPRLGAASPLDPNPNRDAIIALLGTDTLAVASANGSGAEQVLLDSANAAAASPDVRVQLERDKVETEANKPYQPPTVAELLFGKDPNAPDPATVLDPVSESQRLQRQGLATPNDPKATPPDEATPGPVIIGDGTNPERRGPPRNTLPSAQTTPTF